MKQVQDDNFILLFAPEVELVPVSLEIQPDVGFGILEKELLGTDGYGGTRISS